ncbi:MAG: DUF2069 domain-containing protein [Gammaproteobacteria bacterium]|nr:DUF2069 domain-containing protein [Gammaproteobacteria bacterium]
MARKKNKPLPPLEWLQPRMQAARLLSAVLLAALAVLLLVWNLWFADLHGARIWVIASIELAPLLLVAPGMLLGSARVHAWACFMMNLYFIKGVLAWIDPARAWLGAAETLLSVALFTSALLYTRWRYQYERHLAGEGTV